MGNVHNSYCRDSILFHISPEKSEHPGSLSRYVLSMRDKCQFNVQQDLEIPNHISSFQMEPIHKINQKYWWVHNRSFQSMIAEVPGHTFLKKTFLNINCLAIINRLTTINNLSFVNTRKIFPEKLCSTDVRVCCFPFKNIIF